LNLSARTAARLIEYWDALIFETNSSTPATKKGLSIEEEEVESGLAYPPKQRPRLDEGHTCIMFADSIINRVAVRASHQGIELSLDRQTCPGPFALDWSPRPPPRTTLVTWDQSKQEIEVASIEESFPTNANTQDSPTGSETDTSDDEEDTNAISSKRRTTPEGQQCSPVLDEQAPCSSKTAARPLSRILALFTPGTLKENPHSPPGEKILALFSSAALNSIKTTLFPQAVSSPMLGNLESEQNAIDIMAPMTLGNRAPTAVIDLVLAPALRNEGTDLAPTTLNAVDLTPKLGNAPTLGNRVPAVNNLSPTLGNSGILVVPTGPKWTRPASVILAENLDFASLENGRRTSRFGDDTFELSCVGRPTHAMRWMCCFCWRRQHKDLIGV
jgi:hypothetical protein